MGCGQELRYLFFAQWVDVLLSIALFDISTQLQGRIHLEQFLLVGMGKDAAGQIGAGMKIGLHMIP